MEEQITRRGMCHVNPVCTRSAKVKCVGMVEHVSVLRFCQHTVVPSPVSVGESAASWWLYSDFRIL